MGWMWFLCVCWFVVCFSNTIIVIFLVWFHSLQILIQQVPWQSMIQIPNFDEVKFEAASLLASIHEQQVRLKHTKKASYTCIWFNVKYMDGTKALTIHKVLIVFKIQWNLVIYKDLGTIKIILLYQGEKVKIYNKLGPAKLPGYKRVCDIQTLHNYVPLYISCMWYKFVHM